MQKLTAYTTVVFQAQKHVMKSVEYTVL